MSAETILFWIGAGCVALSALQIAATITATFLGWMLRRLRLWDFYTAYEFHSGAERRADPTDATEKTMTPAVSEDN